MRYRLEQIYCRPWLLLGLSPKLLESHYESSYGGDGKPKPALAEALARDFGSVGRWRGDVPRDGRLFGANPMAYVGATRRDPEARSRCKPEEFRPFG
jgi:hypothetical protein